MKSIAAWLSFPLLLMLAGVVAAQAPPPQPAPPGTKGSDLLTAEPLKDDPTDDELRKLLKARYNEALGEVQGQYRLYQKGQGTLESVTEAERRLVQAGLEVYDRPADKIALLAQYVELARATEKMAQARLEAARGTDMAVRRARYQRLDAEIQLLRARREAAKAKEK